MLAVKYENLNGCYSTCITLSLLENIRRVARLQKHNIRGILCRYFELCYSFLHSQICINWTPTISDLINPIPRLTFTITVMPVFNEHLC